MVPAPFRVVLDANVLFPFSLRDTLLRAAAAGYYQVCWSEEILEEARRNLVGRGTITEEQAHRLLSVMRRAFPEAMVSGHEPLTEAMPNDPKDRHVAAAAVRAAAQVIVTFNLKDFRDLPEGIEAQSPSDFLTHVFDLDPPGITALLREQAAAMSRPATTFERLLEGLAKTAPGLVERVRRQIADEVDAEG